MDDEAGPVGRGGGGVIERLRALSALTGAEIKPLEAPVPTEILEQCPEARMFDSPWGPLAVCGDERLWYHGPHGWEEWSGQTLPASAGPDAEAPTDPARPPSPDPPPSPVNPVRVGLWVAGGLGVLLAVIALRILIGGDDEPDDEGAAAAVTTVESTPSSTTTTEVEGTVAPTTSRDAGGRPTFPDGVLASAAVALGLRDADLEALLGVRGFELELEWLPDGSQAPEEAPQVELVSGVRLPEGELFFILLDRPAVDTGTPGGGTQLTLGRSLAPTSVGDIDGFESGYSQLYFLEAGGEAGRLTSYSPDGSNLGDASGALIEGRYGFILVSAMDDQSFVRLGNFHRASEGPIATESDPTAFQVTDMYHLTDDGLILAY